MLGEELVPARLGTPHLTCRHGLLLLELEPALSSQGRIGPAQISRGALPSIFGWLYHMSRGGASNTQGVASRRQGVESKVNGFLTSRVNLSRMRAMRPWINRPRLSPGRFRPAGRCRGGTARCRPAPTKPGYRRSRPESASPA